MCVWVAPTWWCHTSCCSAAAHAVVVTVRFTKTAQYNAGAHNITIKGVKGCLLDPVMWLHRYFAKVPAPANGPCFVLPDSSGALLPLRYDRLVAALKAWLAAAGFDPGSYSCHSLRGAVPQPPSRLAWTPCS
jgi:hypothetical protein